MDRGRKLTVPSADGQHFPLAGEGRRSSYVLEILDLSLVGSGKELWMEESARKDERHELPRWGDGSGGLQRQPQV